jgi:hypothetical protein
MSMIMHTRFRWMDSDMRGSASGGWAYILEQSRSGCISTQGYPGQRAESWSGWHPDPSLELQSASSATNTKRRPWRQSVSDYS